MNDPRRLLLQTGTLEAKLLETVHDADPPPAAKDEIWHRIGMAAGAGAAAVATTPIAVHAAASTATRAVLHAGWGSALKWVVVAGILLPAAGMTARSIVLARSRVAAPTPVSVALPVEKDAVEAVETKGPALDVAPAGWVSPPRSDAPSISSRAVAPRPAAPPLRGSAPSNLDVENGLLKRARAKLDEGDASGALGDATALAARFPHGALVQEREVVAIQALLALKQRSAAASRTAEFLRVFPNSPYGDALRRELGP